MQEHGGKIRVESTLNLGTTFELEFPALASLRRATAEDTSAERAILHA